MSVPNPATTDWVPLGGAPTGGASIVTALPGSPVDGQEVILVDSMTAPTYAWYLRYVSGISDAYKWLFIGGAALSAQLDPQQSMTGTTYADLTAGGAGPSIVLPRAGIYRVDLQAEVYNGTGGHKSFMSYAIGGTAAVDGDAVISNTAFEIAVFRASVKTFATAVTLTAKYRATTGSPFYQKRLIAATPIRLS